MTVVVHLADTCRVTFAIRITVAVLMNVLRVACGVYRNTCWCLLFH